MSSSYPKPVECGDDEIPGSGFSTPSWYQVLPEGLRIMVDGEADLLFSWELIDKLRSNLKGRDDA